MNLSQDEAAIAARLKNDLTNAEAVGKAEVSGIVALWDGHKGTVIVIAAASAALGFVVAKILAHL